MAFGIAFLFALAASAQAIATAPASDVAGKVALESMQNLQIHDMFAAQQQASDEKEKAVKADKNLVAFLQKKTSPDVAGKVKVESMENLQIHDIFAEEEKQDVEHENKVKANKDLSALQLSDSPVGTIAEKVAIEARENIHIQDGFAEEEKKDVAIEKQVKANKDLKALQLHASHAPSFLQSSNAADKVLRQVHASKAASRAAAMLTQKLRKMTKLADLAAEEEKYEKQHKATFFADHTNKQATAQQAYAMKQAHFKAEMLKRSKITGLSVKTTERMNAEKYRSVLQDLGVMASLGLQEALFEDHTPEHKFIGIPKEQQKYQFQPWAKSHMVAFKANHPGLLKSPETPDR